jgi:P-type conjugative transfer protein TrbG
MKTLIVLFALTYVGVAGAQNAEKAPPVAVKRTSAPKSDGADAALQRKIESDLKALQGSPPRTTTEAALPPVVRVDHLEQPPAGYKAPADLPLSPTAEAAVRVSEKWLTEAITPATGPDGRVLYSYGSGLATVVCAPLRLCVVELQSGEHIVSEPHIGDSVRWNIAPAMFGKADSSTTVLIVKPQEPGLDTNLLITTDRRIYYLRLVSKPADYTARVAFAYPDDDLGGQQWKEHLARQQENEREASRVAELSSAAIESMNFDYEIKGDEKIRPVQVFDDGSKTYIRMNPGAKAREAPVLVVVGADGKAEMLNYRVKGDMYIADRLFDRARLLLGSGKNAGKAEIIRDKKKRKS